jgi:hypothetical protein
MMPLSISPKMLLMIDFSPVKPSCGQCKGRVSKKLSSLIRGRAASEKVGWPGLASAQARLYFTLFFFSVQWFFLPRDL